jgi:hypothetical protein
MNMTKQEQLAVLTKLVGKDRAVNRERDFTIRDEKGKLQRDRVAEHAVHSLEVKLGQCVSLKVGVSAFGKGATVDVVPTNMLDLSSASCAEAVAASNPKLATKTEATSVEAQFTSEGVGDIIADHIGSVLGCSDLAAARICAAATTCLYGKSLDAYLDRLAAKEKAPEVAVEKPAKKVRAKKAKKEADTIQQDAPAVETPTATESLSV